MFAFEGVTTAQKYTRGQTCHILRAKRAKIQQIYPRVNFCAMVTPPNANTFGTFSKQCHLYGSTCFLKQAKAAVSCQEEEQPQQEKLSSTKSCQPGAHALLPKP